MQNELKKNVTDCPLCEGAGKDRHNDFMNCSMCEGHGEVMVVPFNSKAGDVHWGLQLQGMFFLCVAWVTGFLVGFVVGR